MSDKIFATKNEYLKQRLESFSTSPIVYESGKVSAVGDGVATVTVTNVGDGLLSVNNLKVVGGGLMPHSDEDLPVMARALATEPITIVPNAYDYDAPVVEEDVQEPETDAPVEDDTPEADEPVTDVPMDLTSIIKMLLKFIETIILKFF